MKVWVDAWKYIEKGEQYYLKNDSEYKYYENAHNLYLNACRKVAEEDEKIRQIRTLKLSRYMFLRVKGAHKAANLESFTKRNPQLVRMKSHFEEASELTQ